MASLGQQRLSGPGVSDVGFEPPSGHRQAVLQGSYCQIPRAAVVRPGMEVAVGGADARMSQRIPHQGHGRAGAELC